MYPIDSTHTSRIIGQIKGFTFVQEWSFSDLLAVQSHTKWNILKWAWLELYLRWYAILILFQIISAGLDGFITTCLVIFQCFSMIWHTYQMKVVEFTGPYKSNICTYFNEFQWFQVLLDMIRSSHYALLFRDIHVLQRKLYTDSKTVRSIIIILIENWNLFM